MTICYIYIGLYKLLSLQHLRRITNWLRTKHSVPDIGYDTGRVQPTYRITDQTEERGRRRLYICIICCINIMFNYN